MILGFVLVILIPIAEVWTAILVAHHIGWAATIALLVLISAVGPSLVRRQGSGVWRRARQRLDEGEVPGREAIDGALLLIAGGLLTFPGFITGALGLLLLLPPVRSLVRSASAAWLARRIGRSSIMVAASFGGRPDASDRRGPVMTAESHPAEHPRRALGPVVEPSQPTNDR
ncbi:MAG: protein FxsA [Acidimicrobiaceae bacterium]|nr:protein FxsA [Acidimicrobiaceae bacterium]